MGLDEFITYLRNEGRVASAKLRDLTEDPILYKGPNPHARDHDSNHAGMLSNV